MLGRDSSWLGALGRGAGQSVFLTGAAGNCKFGLVPRVRPIKQQRREKPSAISPFSRSRFLGRRQNRAEIFTGNRANVKPFFGRRAPPPPHLFAKRGVFN